MMFDLIWLNFALLVIWNTILTLLIVLLNSCQKSQEELLYIVRDEVNNALKYVPKQINLERVEKNDK